MCVPLGDFMASLGPGRGETFLLGGMGGVLGPLLPCDPVGIRPRGDKGPPLPPCGNVCGLPEKGELDRDLSLVRANCLFGDNCRLLSFSPCGGKSRLNRPGGSCLGGDLPRRACGELCLNV